MSYQVLADIAAPLGRASNAKARVYLTKAVELAPGRPEYRRELFSFLLGSSGSSRAARRQAAGILRTASESDPDFQDMRLRFEQERKANAFAAARLGRLFLVIPRATYRVTELPASAFASRGGSEPATPER